MKYYLIVGEASGDLHASHLMTALKAEDPQADFRFFGGDLMAAVGGTMVKHYKELAYMGFIPVLLHLRTIFANMKRCKEDIVAWNPDVVILVDYPGFNLKIAEYIKAHTNIPIFYYISPKIWAWKEYRIKNIKRDVDELFSILPFEVEFFEGKHGYPIHYVGNPTVDEVTAFLASSSETFDDFVRANGLSAKPVIALLAGSRKQEIKDNLPDMLRAAASFRWLRPAFYTHANAADSSLRFFATVLFSSICPFTVDMDCTRESMFVAASVTPFADSSTARLMPSIASVISIIVASISCASPAYSAIVLSMWVASSLYC